jgi:hypothetical protein
VSEDEVVVGAVQRALRPAVHLACEPVGHRYGAARREIGFALGGVLAADPRVADADALGGPDTSRQRRPSSSDWRSPVIAAVSTTTRISGPRTSGGSGGALPARPRRVGAGARTSSGIARSTASSSGTVRNWMSGFASPALRAARAPHGFCVVQPRSIACSKTECRNVMTLLSPAAAPAPPQSGCRARRAPAR